MHCEKVSADSNFDTEQGLIIMMLIMCSWKFGWSSSGSSDYEGSSPGSDDFEITLLSHQFHETLKMKVHFIPNKLMTSLPGVLHHLGGNCDFKQNSDCSSAAAISELHQLNEWGSHKFVNKKQQQLSKCSVWLWVKAQSAELSEGYPQNGSRCIETLRHCSFLISVIMYINYYDRATHHNKLCSTFLFSFNSVL